MDYLYHPLFLLFGLAVAGLTLFGAIAIGPYERRSSRLTLAIMSFAAILGSAFWLITYIGFTDQRRSIETRLSELRTQALNAGSPLACLERAGDVLGTACAQTLFAAPETLAAAIFYTATRLDVLKSAARYSGPRTPQFDDAIAALERSLREDPLGLTANILTHRESCSAERCEVMNLFHDPDRLWINVHQKIFEANLAHYAANWRPPTSTAAPAPPAVPKRPAVVPSGAEARAPLSEKYTLPSADSIPPVSIMNDEPPERPGSAPAQMKDRLKDAPNQPVTAAPVPEPPSAPAQSTTSAPSPPASTEKQAPVRREKTRPNAPLSITPTQ